MASDELLLHIIYLSRIAPGVGFGVVKDIVQLARARNPPAGITGALLFDGERFCQFIEGPREHVTKLMRSIDVDSRHTDVHMIHEGEHKGARVLPNWRSGYCESANDLDVFTESHGLRGEAAVSAFVALALAADLE